MKVLRWVKAKYWMFIDRLFEINPVLGALIAGLAVTVVVFTLIVIVTLVFPSEGWLVTSISSAVGIGAFAGIWVWIDLRR
jgi:hypothetical protein